MIFCHFTWKGAM